jgi:hypothetical protein
MAIQTYAFLEANSEISHGTLKHFHGNWLHSKCTLWNDPLVHGYEMASSCTLKDATPTCLPTPQGCHYYIQNFPLPCATLYNIMYIYIYIYIYTTQHNATQRNTHTLVVGT